MKIQFRVLKHIGGDAFLVYLALPMDQEKYEPNGDPWKHLGVIVMDKEDIEKMSRDGCSIIWTTDILAPVLPKSSQNRL